MTSTVHLGVRIGACARGHPRHTNPSGPGEIRERECVPSMPSVERGRSEALPSKAGCWGEIALLVVLLSRGGGAVTLSSLVVPNSRTEPRNGAFPTRGVSQNIKDVRRTFASIHIP